MSVLLTRGMAAWMQLVQAVPEVTQSIVNDVASLPGRCAVSTDVESEIVPVLANMVMKSGSWEVAYGN
jgi:putative methionine-R-sulfoxide reductase with GAF domain